MAISDTVKVNKLSLLVFIKDMLHYYVQILTSNIES